MAWSVREPVGVVLATCGAVSERAVRGRERKLVLVLLLIMCAIATVSAVEISRLTPNKPADRNGCGLVSLDPPTYGCKKAARR